jgi:hypothetical protein
MPSISKEKESKTTFKENKKDISLSHNSIKNTRLEEELGFLHEEQKLTPPVKKRTLKLIQKTSPSILATTYTCQICCDALSPPTLMCPH